MLPQQLSHLVDRSLKASTRLVVLLTIAALFSSVGLLVVQHRVSVGYKMLFAADSLADDVQKMRLRMGAWVIKGDKNARDDWRSTVRQGQAHLSRLQTLGTPDTAQARSISEIGAQLQRRIDTAESLLGDPDANEREARIETLMGDYYQGINAQLMDGIHVFSKAQQDRLSVLEERENAVLSAAGLVLVALVSWSILSLRRTRHTAARLIRSLDEALRTTARQRSELEAFIDAAPLAVFHADKTGRPTWLNEDAEELVGTERGTSVVETMREGLHADDRERLVRAWNRLLDEATELDEVFRMRSRTGERLWAHAHACPVRVGDDVTGFVAVLRNITPEMLLQEELTRSRHQLQRITDAVPALIARVDCSERYRFVNATYGVWFDAAPTLGESMRNFLGETAYGGIAQYVQQALGGKTVHFEMPRQHIRGRDFVGDVTYTPEFMADGTITGFYIMVTDVSERKELEENLFKANEMAQVTLDSIGDAVITTDEAGIVTFANRRAQTLLERPAATLVGHPIEEVVKLVDGSGKPSESSLRRALVERRLVDMLQPRRLVLDERIFLDVEDVAAPIEMRNGELAGGVLVVRDVSIAQAVADRMRQLAEADPLTGLPNRMVFEQRTRDALAARAGDACLALLYMDLDGFKAVNDTYGHDAGDELLRQFGRRLVAIARPLDVVCRLGGDEFVALLRPVNDPSGALARAGLLIEAAAAPFFWQGIPLHVTLSVGIACIPDDGADALTLLRKADAALYSAKRSGRNRAILFGALQPKKGCN
ncbi:sensor domain-containing diguanylate cyclase [Luteibacter aegosomaticola]|uniref:sensor domain-containing diguanylate cyclase n=1 Tax=Luteibacter aegosomaticola TaxID=2911538 RepID=UPI001FFA430F|nr:sensor domain-containing diguanylate cyclase [Luteibacter aegosomaticola]UPG88226.1 sensor domain-containing diguanylate cyclase [Luteibacter aegosomaticola]